MTSLPHDHVGVGAACPREGREGISPLSPGCRPATFEASGPPCCTHSHGLSPQTWASHTWEAPMFTPLGLPALQAWPRRCCCCCCCCKAPPSAPSRAVSSSSLEPLGIGIVTGPSASAPSSPWENPDTWPGSCWSLANPEGSQAFGRPSLPPAQCPESVWLTGVRRSMQTPAQSTFAVWQQRLSSGTGGHL